MALIHPVKGFEEAQQASFNELQTQFQVSDLKVFQIPRHAPLTPEQFEAQAKLWPTISRFVSQYVLILLGRRNYEFFAYNTSLQLDAVARCIQ